ANGGGGREWFVIDDHGFRRIVRLVLGLGDYNRDRLSDKANGLRRHRRPGAHLHRRAVPGRNRPAADEIADLVVDDLFAGQYADHARHFHGCRGVDALYFGMGVGAADEIGMGHAHELDIIDVAAFACTETSIFLAHYAGADTFNTHRISPCRAVSPRAKKSVSADCSQLLKFQRPDPGG